MPCNASYARLLFLYTRQFDMQPMCTPMLANFFFKKWVLHGSANGIRGWCSIEVELGLSSTGYVQENMRSSKIEQNNDRVLIPKERTSKNFLTRRNLLQRSEIGTANSRRWWVDHSLRLIKSQWWGPRSEALPRLGTLTGEVPNLITIEARETYPSRLRSSRWSSQPQVDWRTRGQLLRWTVAPLL
jgi:hypothetical protein